MTEENKQCWSCVYFSLYYTCGWDNFYPKDIGLCRIGAKIISKEDCCKKWRSAKNSCESRKERALSAISGLHKRLEAIEQTLQQAIELEKLNKN